MTWLESFVQDLRYGTRQLRQTPGFTAVAVLSLALGIGANTAIFQLVDAVRLRTLPVKSPQELVTIDFAPGSDRSGWFSTRSARLTYAQWEELSKHRDPFSGVFAWSAARFNLAQGGVARYAEGLYVSGQFFEHLGAVPVLGRTFAASDDDLACGNPGAVISYAFWHREFGGDKEVLNRKVTLDGRPFPVIGVTGSSFFGVEVGRRYDVAIPICADKLLSEDNKGRIPVKHAWWLSMMGRLRPGWTAEKADAYMKTISPRITQATVPPNYKPEMVKRYVKNKLAATSSGTGVSNLRRQYERPLWMLLATTGLVLLIACANLANLLLAKASVREREVAVRLAIGASRGRLVRQLLAESLLLAAGGAVLGALLAQVLSRGLVAFLTTENSPLFIGIGIDARILAFTTMLALGTCVLFGLLPALRATQIAPVSSIRAGGRSMTAGKERFSVRRALVAIQVALSLVLLVGALLFVRSLQNLMATDSGFQAEGVLAVSLDMRQPQYSKEQMPVVRRELLRKLSAQPGVESAAQVFFTPVSGSGWNNEIGPDGTVAAGSGKESFFNRISPGYFQTMGTPIISGRDFNNADTRNSAKVAIVNEVFAKKHFGGKNPVGRTFRMEAPAGKPEELYQIVGLVKNTKYYELREDFMSIGFLAMEQDDDPGAGATYVLRIRGSVAQAMASAKKAVAEVSQGIGIDFRPMSKQLEESLLRDRLMATLSGAFGFLAGSLATLGLYGVIAYMVARRRKEIGIRMALGADRGSVLMLVLREAALLLAVGFGVGALIAVWAGRAASTMLYGLKPHDPVVMAAAMALLAFVALAASYGPARKAAGMNPMNALRDE